MSYTGGCRAEFGIIDNIDPLRDYGHTYEPERSITRNGFVLCKLTLDYIKMPH